MPKIMHFPTCPNENENSPHVVQSQGGRRIVIRIAAISSPTVEDPFVVQVFHFAACRGWNQNLNDFNQLVVTKKFSKNGLLSWKSSMARVTLSDHGDPFCNPTPYPLLPNKSPAVMRAQSRAASYSSLDESQMKAFSFLSIDSKVSIRIFFN